MNQIDAPAKGVYTATLSPLSSDLQLDHDKLVKHCKWLLSRGSDGIALMGTTGEATSFTIAERMAMLESVVSRGIPVDKLMVGTGCCSFPDTIQLTQHAIALGVTRMLMLPPFYYKSLADVGLLNYFEKVIRGTADDKLKIYLYHIPQITGVPFSLKLTQELVKEFPKTIVGMKDSGGDWEHMSSITKAIPDFQMFAGTEKFLLEILQIGGVGCISATANATSVMASKVYQAFQNGAANVEELQTQLLAARTAFEGFQFVSALKTQFAVWQNDPAWLNVRPPNVVLPDSQLKELQARLKDIHFQLN